MALVPIQPLLAFSPFDYPVWDIEKPITREEVKAALANPKHIPYTDVRDSWTRADHAGRIAFFVNRGKGWDDKIDLDVGVPVLSYFREWWPTDGHHRLAAAIYRGDTHVHVSVSGQIDYAAELLGVSEDDLKEGEDPEAAWAPSAGVR